MTIRLDDIGSRHGASRGLGIPMQQFAAERYLPTSAATAERDRWALSRTYRSAVLAAAIRHAHVAPSVLIIDDDADVRVYLEDVFHLEGFEVTPLSDPTVVVERIRNELFHILVIDLMMPKIDGLDLLAQIRAFDAHIPVIMVTGYPSLETVSASIELGISAYLAHPITPTELRDAITRIAKQAFFVPRHEGI
jgi:CheY-like chemotaxis protein